MGQIIDMQMNGNGPLMFIGDQTDILSQSATFCHTILNDFNICFYFFNSKNKDKAQISTKTYGIVFLRGSDCVIFDI